MLPHLLPGFRLRALRALVFAAGLAGCEPAPTPVTQATPPIVQSGGVAVEPRREAGSSRVSATDASGITRPAIGFRSDARLEEHWRKHGGEFGDPTREEYLAMAQRLRDAPDGDRIVELVRSDGVITRFDRSSGAFLAFERDGTIRTFFRPNDGEAYFRRQARRRPTS